MEADPSSIAFAQLAEEYRRSGNFEAAEQCCRTGLTRHPSYLSARVTLGRTLIELDKLDEAEDELNFVLKSAPDNLAAIRGMAEIHQRRGNLELALDFYRRALPLARHDPEIEENVRKINDELGVRKPKDDPGLSFQQAQAEFLNALSQLPALTRSAEAAPAAPAPQAEPEPEPAPVPPQAPSVSEASRTAIDNLAAAVVPAADGDDATIDFDSLLKSLGVPDHQPPASVEALLTEPAAPAARPEPVLPDLPLNAEQGDPFAELERGLREFDAPSLAPDETASASLAEEPPAAPASEPLGYGEFSFNTTPAYEEAPAAPVVAYGQRLVEEAAAESVPAPVLAPAPALASASAPVQAQATTAAEVDPTSEDYILEELEAWLAAIKR